MTLCCHKLMNGLGSDMAAARSPHIHGAPPAGDPVPHLNVALVPAPGQVVVRLTGDADYSTVPLLTDALTQAAGITPGDLVVDVAAARFWDSAALRVLATMSARLNDAGRGCRIVGAGRATRRLNRVADLGDRLELAGPVDRPAPRSPEPLRSARTPVEAAHSWH